LVAGGAIAAAIPVPTEVIVLACVCAALGDRIASLHKRRLGLKDFSAIYANDIGGLLDRWSSTIVAVVPVFIYLVLAHGY
jgi:CDP-diglyceride synthetase